MTLALVRSIAPGRNGLAAIIQSFFDESYGDDNPYPFCVAGYVFTKLKLAAFERDWRSMLRKWELPYFHMVDCAHGNPPFDKLGRDGCINAAKDAISIIQKYAALGVGITLDPDKFEKDWQHKEIIKSAYECCVWMSVVAIKKWADEVRPSARFSYIFEQGYVNNGRALQAMVALFSDPELKAKYRSPGFGFVEKADSPGVQAADLLAWQLFTENKRIRDGIRPKARKDFSALMAKPQHVHAYVDLEAWNDQVLAAARARRDAGGG